VAPKDGTAGRTSSLNVREVPDVTVRRGAAVRAASITDPAEIARMIADHYAAGHGFHAELCGP
jgi:hypothetical protein